MPPRSLSDTPSLMETHLGPSLCALCALGIAGASSCLPWNLLRGRGAGWASATGYILALPGLLPGGPLALPRQPICSQQELINLFFYHFPVSLVAQAWAGHCSGANRPANKARGVQWAGSPLLSGLPLCYLRVSKGLHGEGSAHPPPPIETW